VQRHLLVPYRDDGNGVFLASYQQKKPTTLDPLLVWHPTRTRFWIRARSQSGRGSARQFDSLRTESPKLPLKDAHCIEQHRANRSLPAPGLAIHSLQLILKTVTKTLVDV
jgi:hypothetical protein